MAGIFAAAATIGSVIDIIKNSKEGNLAQAVKDIRDTTTKLNYDGSITKLLSKFIVEPVVIISKDAKRSDIADKMITLNTDMFCSFYLQAFNVLMNMHHMESNMAVDVLSTDGPGVFGTAANYGIDKGIEWLEANESFKDYFGDLIENKYLTVSTEKKKDKEPANYHRESTEYRDKMNDAKFDYKSNKVADLAGENLYYVHTRELNITLKGQISELSVREDKETAHYENECEPEVTKNKYENTRIKDYTFIIPIVVKTHIIETSIDSILNMLKPNDRTKKFGYRFDEWRSGAISLRELIFCGDLINSYKKNKLKDKDGLLNIIKQREESANAKVVNTKMIGFEKFYNMLVVTADEKIILNKHVAGNIDNEKYKQDLLTQAHALFISILDEDYERAYILTKDIRGRTDVSYKALSRKNDKNNDIADMVKQFMANKSPAF